MPADPTVEVFGVYPVDGVESCYLVELMITGSDSPPAFAEFTQPMPGSPRSDWQVPYDEKLLDDDGAGVLVDLFFEAPESWPSRARVAFYFHELFAEEPMSTPFGETALPQPSPMPERLSFLAYEAP